MGNGLVGPPFSHLPLMVVPARGATLTVGGLPHGQDGHECPAGAAVLAPPRRMTWSGRMTVHKRTILIAGGDADGQARLAAPVAAAGYAVAVANGADALTLVSRTDGDAVVVDVTRLTPEAAVALVRAMRAVTATTARPHGAARRRDGTGGPRRGGGDPAQMLPEVMAGDHKDVRRAGLHGPALSLPPGGRPRRPCHLAALS